MKSPECSGNWLNCALEVLQENNIYPAYFSTVVVLFFLAETGSTGLQLHQCSNIIVTGLTEAKT